MPPKKKASTPPPDSNTIVVRRDETCPLDDLTPFHKNPRRGDVDLIAGSLREHGQYRDLIVNVGTHTDRPNEILAGNHTYAAMRDMGWETCAVSFVDVDDAKAAKIVVVDNRASDKAKNDQNTLADLLGSFDDLSGTGYTDEDLVKLLGNEDADTGPQLDDNAYAVIIDCDDETQQAELLAQFEDEGLRARPLMM